MDAERERALWIAIRQALLMAVDAIERYLGLPRTAEMRRQADARYRMGASVESERQ